jgi:hypothetical protein
MTWWQWLLSVSSGTSTLVFLAFVLAAPRSWRSR